MSNDPASIQSANSEDLAVTEYDAARFARLADEKRPDAGAALPTNDEVPEVGLSQKGDGEDAVVKRETEI
jgi:hypothetical protein